MSSSKGKKKGAGNSPPSIHHGDLSPECVFGTDFKLCFDNDSGLCGVALWHFDLKRGVLRFSPEWRGLTHQTKDVPLEYKYETWADAIHEEDRKELHELLEALRTGASAKYSAVFRMQREDGCWAWFLVWAAVSQFENGKPMHLCGTVTDISALRSDNKFQHGNLGVGNAAYHAMLENSPDLLVRMDRELFPLYINPVVTRYMGRQAHEFSYSENVEELGMDPRQLEFLKENVDYVFDHGKATRKMVSFIDYAGREVTGEYSFWPEFDADGRVVSAMTQFRDLTEQIEAQKSAQFNEQRLTALYTLTQMGEAPSEELMRFVLQNLIELTGSKSGFIFIPDNDISGPGRMAWSIKNQNFYDEHIPDNHVLVGILSDMGIVVEDPSHWRCIVNGDGRTPVYLAPEASMSVMRMALVPITESGQGVCLAGVVNKEIEYTEADLKQIELFIIGAWLNIRRHEHIRELRVAKEAAEYANKVKSEFLANVSHELRTPLNGLLSMLQLMDYMPLSEEQREYIRAANLSGNALLRIISDILDFSRMENGKMKLQSDNFDLKQTVSSSLSLFKGEAEQKGLKFFQSIDASIPDQLMGDDARVRQILFNVVGNALKFTEKGSIQVDCVRSQEESPSGRIKVLLTVLDSGIGIPREQQNRIFEAFTQVDSSTTRRYPGTGLGLGITKHLVSLMNGSINLESEEGKGTRVTCILEFALPAQKLKQVNGKSAAKKTSAPVALNILVAEDDSVSRFAIRSFLLRMGHHPVCVTNGTEAIEALKLHPFHCLLTDIQMPDMDGMELVRRIREGNVADIPATDATRKLIENSFPGIVVKEEPIDRGIAVVAVSAHAMAGDKERFLREGMDFYISKPVVAEELSQTLGKLVNQLRDTRPHFFAAGGLAAPGTVSR